MYTNDSGPLNTVHNVNDAAVIVMNAKTGELLAMDGSADYDATDPRIGGQFNVADPPQSTDGAAPGRGPGSTFKPIIYATAFQMGWHPELVLPDFKTYFPNGSPPGTSAKSMYAPPDYSSSGDPEYHHNTFSTIREATANSYNVPAMKAMEYAGPQNVLVTAERMGITTLQNDGIAWGLGSQNVPLIQMVGAYQVFANAGRRVPPQGILDIWDNYGHSLYHYDPQYPPAALVLSPQVAYLMTSVLMDEPAGWLEFPGDHDLSFTDRDPSCAYNSACTHQVAAKTGTTDHYVDNLTIGYTPNVVVGVWAGNADNSPMRNVLGITGTTPIWHSVIEFAGMGWCNEPTDQVHCPSINRSSWHFAQQDTFPVPT
jgi:membrane peptidoglycan carboxypeptidase